MKLKAIFILICLIAWFAETLATVKIVCPEKVGSEKKTCLSMSCSKRMTAAKKKTECNKSSPDNKEKGNGTCNDAASCLNCPLCFVGTFPGSFSLGSPGIPANKKYPAIHFSGSAGFPGNSWKPPDFCI